ncbi:MAG: rhomboid family intramembrane serine protease [Planctomycetales bacterium]
MRHIGNLPNEEAARTFHNHLLANGMPSQVEEEDGESAEWSVWIIDEDHVSEARRALAEFQRDPAAPEYAAAGEKADRLRREQARREKRIRSKSVDIRRRWERPWFARAPITAVLIALSILATIFTTNWSDPLNWNAKAALHPVTSHLHIAPLVVDAQTGELLGWYPVRGLEAIRHGQIWRLVTPIFMHFGLLHIVFNMLWMRQLGVAIELRRGSLKFLWFVLLIAAVSNLAQYHVNMATDSRSGPFFGGMSGVVFGLFGYMWMQSKLDPFSGFFMPPNLVFWMIAWFFLCMTGVVGQIANTAHGVGLGVGMLLGVAGPMLRRMR